MSAAQKKPRQKPRASRGAGAPGFNGAPLVPGNPGNSGGKPGRSGRKRLPFVEECSTLTDTSVIEKVRLYLAKEQADPTDSAWRWCAEYVSGYSKSKPAQAVRHTDKDDNDIPAAQLHLHLGDNGRGLEPPIPMTTNGNGRRA